MIGRPVRRVRRRSLVAGAAVGAAVAHNRSNNNAPQEEYEEAPAQPDQTEELKKLADLHTQGVITDQEFEAKKKQILGI